MWPYEFKDGIGTLPTGEKKHYDTEREYREEYRKEEDLIYDFMAEVYAEELDYPEDWRTSA